MIRKPTAARACHTRWRAFDLFLDVHIMSLVKLSHKQVHLYANELFNGFADAGEGDLLLTVDVAIAVSIAAQVMLG